VLALTAMASAADRQQALAAGFNQHLTKPVDLELLLVVLVRLLQSAQPSQGLGELEENATVP
jgi:CheY-like chemotaxis protein